MEQTKIADTEAEFFGCKTLYPNKQITQTHLYLSRAAPSWSGFMSTAGIRREREAPSNVLLELCFPNPALHLFTECVFFPLQSI